MPREGNSQHAHVVRISYTLSRDTTEACWAVVKNHCAATCDYTTKGLRAHVAEGFNKVTPATCQAAIADVRTEEDRYWREDMEDDEEGELS